MAEITSFRRLVFILDAILRQKGSFPTKGSVLVSTLVSKKASVTNSVMTHSHLKSSAIVSGSFCDKKGNSRLKSSALLSALVHWKLLQ